MNERLPESELKSKIAYNSRLQQIQSELFERLNEWRRSHDSIENIIEELIETLETYKGLL